MPTKKVKKKRAKRPQQQRQSYSQQPTADDNTADGTGDPSRHRSSGVPLPPFGINEVNEAHLVSALTKVCQFEVPENPTNSNMDMQLTEDERPYALGALRAKYQTLGRGEWWWLFDDSVHHICCLLRAQSYAVLDGFFATPQDAQPAGATCDRALSLQQEVKRKWKSGMMPIKGAIVDATAANAKDGTNTYIAQTKEGVRGDFIGWFDGTADEGWSTADKYGSLNGYITKISTLVTEMAKFMPEELGNVRERSRVMVTCYPPGSRYTRHVDNGGSISNGRRLTTLLYDCTVFFPHDEAATICA